MPNEETVEVYDRYFEVYKQLRLALDPVFMNLKSI
jgi:hypothetical protein